MRLVALASALALFPCAAAAQLEIFSSPDVTTDLSGTTVRDREGAIDDLMGGIVIDDFGGLPDGTDVTALNEEVGARVLFSTDVSVPLPGGVVARPRDVVRTNGSTYVLEFDGATNGVPDGVAVDAVARSAAGDLVLSFDVSVSLGGVRADDEDLLSFDGAAFALVFDGSAEGVDPGLDLDGAGYAGEGRYAVSFDGPGSLGGVSFADEDVITLKPGVAGAKLFFDASAEHAGWAGSDLDAVALPEPGLAAGLAFGAALLAALGRRRGSKRRMSALLLLIAAAPAQAVDGVREINQTCAETTGCFTGDSAGFPVTITLPGSYRLTGNLAIPNAVTHGIRVDVDGVSVDLNGFEISGVTSCTGSPVSCSGTGSGRGVSALDQLVAGLYVHGGTIRGVGDDAVFVGNSGRVEDVRSLGNGGDGIEGVASAQILRCTIFGNGGQGIRVSANGIIAGNVVVTTGTGQTGISAGNAVTIEGNRITGANGDGISAGGRAVIIDNGIALSGGDAIEASFATRVQGNVMSSSTGFGLRFTSSESGYADNIFSLNTGGNVTGPGVNLGGNLCGAVICP